MDLTFITEYISPIALVICLAVGYVIKYCIKSNNVNRFIPLIVAIIGVVICAWGDMAITPQIVAAGLISGLASTGLYEAFRQIVNIKEGTE